MSKQHQHRSLFVVATLLPLAVAGCSSSGGGGVSAGSPAPTLTAGAEAGGSGSPNDPLSALTGQTTFTPTAGSGVETINVSAGAAITAETNPTVSFTRTTTGFDMQTADGTVRYDTRANSRHNTGTTNQYAEVSGSSTITTTFTRGAAAGLSYATYGSWNARNATGTTRVGVFSTGIPTTAAQLPTTGTATYTGGSQGYVVTSAAGVNTTSSFSGAATFNTDFGSRIVTGGVTGITTRNVATGAAGSMGSIVFGSGSYNGTAITSLTGGIADTDATVNIGNATGTMRGTFYGPNANEIAGTYNLNGTGVSVIGSYGAKR